jgi:hypothetical protein
MTKNVMQKLTASANPKRQSPFAAAASGQRDWPIGGHAQSHMDNGKYELRNSSKVRP